MGSRWKLFSKAEAFMRQGTYLISVFDQTTQCKPDFHWKICISGLFTVNNNNNNNNSNFYLSDFVLVAASRTLIPKRKVNVHSWIVWRYISISISWLKLCEVETTISLGNFKNIVCSLTHQVEKDSLLRQPVLTIDHCVYQTSFAPVADLTLKM